MADLKISALTASTTPLAGTEVLPIVQSGTTKQVSVANLTVGRDTTVKNLIATGALTVGTSGTYGTGTVYADASWGMLFTSAVSAPTQANFAWLTYAGAEIARMVGTDFKLASGNVVIGTSGKGIDFSATPGTGTSELFADYEEGTWTPTDASGAGLTFTSVTGFYTKVGRLVTCTFGLTFPATVSGANLTIGGLPYTSISSGPPNVSGGSLTYTTAAVNSAGFAIGQGATTGLLFNSAGAFFANAAFSGAILRMQFTYTAA
jgi:hypothetical protein